MFNPKAANGNILILALIVCLLTSLISSNLLMEMLMQRRTLHNYCAAS